MLAAELKLMQGLLSEVPKPKWGKMYLRHFLLSLSLIHEMDMNLSCLTAREIHSCASEFFQSNDLLHKGQNINLAFTSFNLCFQINLKRL